MAFKKAPDGQLLEAWRILRHAVGDRGLPASSIEVEKWHNEIRSKYNEHEKSVWKAVPATPASDRGVSSVTLVSKAYVEETLALKKRKARPMDEGALEAKIAELKAQLQVKLGSHDPYLGTIFEQPSSGDNLLARDMSSAWPTAKIAELMAQLQVKAQWQVMCGIQDPSPGTIFEQPSSGDNLLAGDMSSAWSIAALGQESASSTPLPAVGRAAVVEAGSATLDTAVDLATPESATSTPLPVPGPVAVFGAGSATPVAVGEARLCTEGSKDGKLNPTQFASMNAHKAKYRDNVRYRETRKVLSLANEALIQAVMFDLAQRPTDNMLPENCENKWFQYGPCPVFVSKGKTAVGIITPDPAFDTGKNWITAQWVESRKVIQEIRLSETLQERYAVLLSVLPPSTSVFYGAMPTVDDKIVGLLGVLALHKGEVVEISPNLSEWYLAEGAVPAIADTLSCWSEQFLCLPTTLVPQGKGAGKSRHRQPLAAVPQPVIAQGNNIVQRWEFGQRAVWDDEIKLAAEVSARFKRTSSLALHPDWGNQVLRSIVPCKQMPTMHWRRVCQCITLGRLFGMLGQDYSADVLYHFYRTRRILVAKKKKGK